MTMTMMTITTKTTARKKLASVSCIKDRSVRNLLATEVFLCGMDDDKASSRINSQVSFDVYITCMRRCRCPVASNFLL